MYKCSVSYIVTLYQNRFVPSEYIYEPNVSRMNDEKMMLSVYECRKYSETFSLSKVRMEIRRLKKNFMTGPGCKIFSVSDYYKIITQDFEVLNHWRLK